MAAADVELVSKNKSFSFSASFCSSFFSLSFSLARSDAGNDESAPDAGGVYFNSYFFGCRFNKKDSC